MHAPDQMNMTARLPPRLRTLAGSIGDVAVEVSRRYFTLLPIAHSLGMESETLLGAA